MNGWVGRAGMGKQELDLLSGGEWDPEQPDVEDGDIFDPPSSLVM